MNVIQVDGTKALPTESSSFGRQVPIYLLYPGLTNRAVLNLHEEYLFPKAGTYEIWIEYDSTQNTCAWFDYAERVDEASATSNVVEFDVSEEDRVRVNEPTAEQLQTYWRVVEQQRRRKWWRFWG